MARTFEEILEDMDYPAAKVARREEGRAWDAEKAANYHQLGLKNNHEEQGPLPNLTPSWERRKRIKRESDEMVGDTPVPKGYIRKGPSTSSDGDYVYKVSRDIELPARKAKKKDRAKAQAEALEKK